MNMYQDNVKLTAYRSDEESWRLVRLERIIGYICALSEHYGNNDLLNKIEELRDHKGTLTVKWKTEPTDGEKEILLKSWMSIVGDGSNNVEHEIAKS